MERSWSAPREWHRLGARIIELRQARRMSQSELGGAMSLSVDYIARVEQGQHRPKRARVRKLAQVLEVDYWELAAMAGYQSVVEEEEIRTTAEKAELVDWFADLPLEKMEQLRRSANLSGNQSSDI